MEQTKEQTPTLQISITAPVVSDLGVQFGGLPVARPPESSTSPALTIRCGRGNCKKEFSRTAAKKVKARDAEQIITMLICPDCYDHYTAKPSTSVNRATGICVPVNFEQIRRDVAASQRGNQSQVMPVSKSGRLGQRNATAASGSHRPTSLQNLVPTGWAPGPAGRGAPFEFPALKIALPKECTAPLALQQYEAVRDQLRERTRAGGHDAITVALDGRLTVQEAGRIYPTVIVSDMINNVPIRIDQKNLQHLILNALLSGWLKLFLDYPLESEHVESVRLVKGRSGVHLDNKEHAILEHCLNSDGPRAGTKSKSKSLPTSLSVMLVIDVNHYKKAKAHKTFQETAQVKDQGPLSHSEPESTPTLFVSCSTRPRTRPQPRPIFGKKRKVSEEQAGLEETVHAFGGQKRTRSDRFSDLGPLKDLKQALIAQREPQPAAIDGLLNTVSFPILFWLCPTKPLRLLISKHATDSGFGEWTQKVQLVRL
ncbi:hypothetical protein EDB83DRAFT_2681679 [Lactarius deliciosus]|nr:hypothetical protein EDB83DRAFT_2681679 [Lactarius deliciosus]